MGLFYFDPFVVDSKISHAGAEAKRKREKVGAFLLKSITSAAI
jgi:hypothetical protein